MREALLFIGIGLVLLFPRIMIGQVYTENFDTGIPSDWVTYTEAGFDFVNWFDGDVSLFKQSNGDEILLLGMHELDLSLYTKMEVDMYAYNLDFNSNTKPYIHIGILWNENDINSFEVIKIVHVTNETYELYDVFLGAYSGMGRLALKMVGENRHITYVDNFKLYDDDFEANFPLAVDIISAVPASAGGLSIDIDWTNPTLEADGDMLQSLDSVVFYADGIPLYTHLNPVVGADESATIPVSSANYYKIEVVPFSSGNAGYERETEVYWVGLDFPSVVSDLSIEINGDQVTLSLDSTDGRS